MPERASPRPRPTLVAAPRPARPRPANGGALWTRPYAPLPEERRFVQAAEEYWAAHAALERTKDLPGVEELIRQSSLGVQVFTHGLGYSGVVQDLDFTISRAREQRGDLTGELAIGRSGNSLFRTRVNLSNAQARAGAARLLASLPGAALADTSHREGDGPPRGQELLWRSALELLCTQVLDLARRPSALVLVGSTVAPADTPRVLAPYLPMGPTLLWGPQGSGKSTLAAAVVYALEEMAEVLPGWRFPPEYGSEGRRCLVLDWEASAGEWNDRLQRIAAGAEGPQPQVAYMRCSTPLADQVEELSAVIAERGIGYLVVDSFEKAAGARTEGSTYEEKAERVFLALDRLGLPSLLLDHVTGEELRSGGGRLIPKSIGSTLKGAWARATYDLKRDPDRENLTGASNRTELLLHNVKMNDGRTLPTWEFAIEYGEGERGAIRFIESRATSAELTKSLPLGERLRRLLLDNPGSVTTKEAAEVLETTPATLRSLLKRDGGRRFVRLPNERVGLAVQEHLPLGGPD